VVAHNAVTPAEAIKAVDAFPQFGGDLAFVGQAKVMAVRLQGLTGDMTDDLSVMDWIKKLVTFKQIMESAR
jgi:hypothetical protein